MGETLRRSGIEIIGDVPWGLHFCLFYHTRQDLLDILLPYFKAGLENNEFCMWVASEPLPAEEALEAFRRYLPDLERCLAKGQLEIIPRTEWYLKGGSFDARRVLNGWVERLNAARAHGFDGLRLTGNAFWLEKKDWRDFVACEEEVNRTIGKYRMIALCTYSTGVCTAAEVIDVVSSHQYALSKRDGKWSLIESSERREAERRITVTNDLLKLYTRKFSHKEYLDVAVELIRAWSGCRHIGVRIADEHGNIPYEACVGYNAGFLQSESILSLHRDQCICIRVVAGAPEFRELADMTPQGSFFSNDTAAFVGRLTAEQKTRYRAVCMRHGYTSLAVVPIRYRDKIIGAIHIADERAGMVPRRNVEFIEQLAFVIGEAIFRFGIEEELRKLNRELERRVSVRTAQLEAANRELEAFAYSVSHDLRAPLRSIDGFSNAILEDYAGVLDEAGRGYFDRIRAAAGKMGQLIDALLNLSRLMRGELRRGEADLSALARSAADELRKSEPGRAVRFVIADGAKVEGDPVMLRAVIENLLSNAWKFTRRTEDARIEFGVIERGTRNSKPETVYYVRDNGAGFDMAYAGKLFNAFQRLHGGEDFPGLGIGLATVQRIIHRHGGEIWAEGEVNKGATFYFTL